MPSVYECAIISWDVYSDYGASKVAPTEHLPWTHGWHRLSLRVKSHSGFQGAAYRSQGGQIVVAYRGTDELVDMLEADRRIASRRIPFYQFLSAIELYNKAPSPRGGQAKVVTGHSLGGVLAKAVASLNNVPAVAFQAPGIRHPRDGRKSWKKVINVRSRSWTVDKLGNFRAEADGVHTYWLDGLGPHGIKGVVEEVAKHKKFNQSLGSFVR